MPTYTYICKDCGHKYDKLQSITTEPDKTCPQCSGEVERLIGGGIGIVFKGTGFYVTDYKKNSPNNDSKQNKSEKQTKTEAKTSP
jgi:putative FmdB family regulatory protein